MSLVGNLLWLFFGGGLFLGLSWLLYGFLWCLTLVGIPIGVACFRIAGFAFCPFGKELVPAEWVGEKTIPGTTLMNIMWCAFSGLWLAAGHISAGIFDCCTIIGIPFGLANFKIAIASFAPLGKRAVPTEVARIAREKAAQAYISRKTGQTP